MSKLIVIVGPTASGKSALGMELAKKYQGKLDVIGVDIWESNDPKINTLPKVTAFVKSEGAKMDYHVAADTLDGRISSSWMKPAGEGGIPTAFIIGKDELDRLCGLPHFRRRCSHL